MLYQLSYASTIMERETGIEPATNSLEGCDSTIELLPLVAARGAAGAAWPRADSPFHCTGSGGKGSTRGAFLGDFGG